MASDPALSTIKQDILRIINQRDEALANLPIPLTATSDGAVGTIITTQLTRGSGQSNRYDARQGEWFTDGGTNGPGIGRKFAVDDAGFTPSTGTLATSPDFPNASDSGDDFVLYALGLSPEYVEEHINEVFRKTRGPHIYFPSLFDDSDFLAANLTAWPDDTTPGTTANELLTTGVANLLGARAIHFVASAADQGVRSLDAEVHEGENMVFACWVKAAVGSVDVRVFDTTNGETIKEVVVDEQGWTLVAFTFAVPAGCEQIRLRLQSNANLDDIFLSAHVVLQSLSGGTYPLADWWDSETQINGWQYMPFGTNSEAGDSYVALSRAWEAHPQVQIVRDELGVHPFRLIMDTPQSHFPLVVNVQREFSEITMGTVGSNATTTPIDREYVVYRAVANMMRDMGDETFRGWNRLANDRAVSKGYHRRGIWIDPNESVAV